MELIHNNFLRGSGHGPTWKVAVDPPTRPVKSYYEEVCIAAEMVWTQKLGTVYVSLSGGLDSEFILAVLLSLGMKATPVIMKTKYNHPETAYAFKFCEKNNLTPVIIDLDYDEFIKSGEMLDYCKTMKCGMPWLASNNWLIKQLDGTVLTGNDPPHMKKKDDGLWYLDEEEFIHSQLRAIRKQRIHGTPYLLSYTPEVMYSFLTHPTIVTLANDRLVGKIGTNSSKVRVFNTNKGKFNLEQRVKKSGYELVRDNDIFEHPDLQEVLSWEHWRGSSDHQYHELIKTLDSGNTSIK
jgi:hypothetical protein